MNCPYCGNELREGAKFCTRCGAMTPEIAAGSAPAYGYTGYGSGETAAPETTAPETTDTGRQRRYNGPSSYSAEPDTYAAPSYAPAPATDYHAAPAADYRSTPAADYHSAPAAPAAAPAPVAVQSSVPAASRSEDCYSVKDYRGNPQFRPLTAWGYFWLSLLYMVPIVGFIFLMIHTFSRKNLVRRSFARSHFCALLIFGIAAGVLFGILMAVGGMDSFRRFFYDTFRIRL